MDIHSGYALAWQAYAYMCHIYASLFFFLENSLSKLYASLLALLLLLGFWNICGLKYNASVARRRLPVFICKLETCIYFVSVSDGDALTVLRRRCCSCPGPAMISAHMQMAHRLDSVVFASMMAQR